MATESTAESLRRALLETSGADFESRLLRASLGAAVAGRRDLEEILLDASLAGSAELDLHLSGDGTIDHSTRADFLGKLLARSANAVKELAKDIGGLARHTPGLLTEAPSPGSVRIVLRTPEVKAKAPKLPQEETETLDAKALHQFASILLQANDEDPDRPLEASILRLRGEARQALKLVGQAVVDANWDVDGALAMRGHGRQPVHLNQAGARRLVEVAKLRESELIERRMIGDVDGWTWSASTMRFDPGDGRAFTASVPPDLQEKVAMINGRPDHRAVADFVVTKTFPQGDAQSARRSYALVGIEVYAGDAFAFED